MIKKIKTELENLPPASKTLRKLSALKVLIENLHLLSDEDLENFVEKHRQVYK